MSPPCRPCLPAARAGTPQMAKPRAATSTSLAAWLAPVLAACTAALLAALPWEQEVQYGQQRNLTRLGSGEDIENELYRRTTVQFKSQGTMVEAWLYTAADGTPAPVVLMAHGLGSQKDMGLHAYAERFASAGLAVLAFDFRTFGGSDGEPRQVVNWRHHVEDWEAAVGFVREGGLGPAVDPLRIGLWGVSYSGGQVLVAAAKLGSLVSAVVANEPYLSGNLGLHPSSCLPTSARRGRVAKLLSQEGGALKLLRMLAVAINDQVRGLLGLPAAYIKLIGSGQDLALLRMEGKELEASRPRRGPLAGGWRPSVPARMLLSNFWYHPLGQLHSITAPVLIRAGTKDDVCPLEEVHAAMEILRARPGTESVLLEAPYGHIELFRHGFEEQEIAPVIQFLKKNLGMAL